MRTTVRLMFCFVLTLCFITVSYAQQQPRPQPRVPAPSSELKRPAYMKADANLYITVIDQGTGSRMSQVKVVITERATGEIVSKAAMTDSFGGAKFNVPDGEYIATLTKIGFMSTSSPFVKAGPSSFTFNMSESTADDLVRPVSSVGIVSPDSRTIDRERFAVTVMDRSGSPIAGVKLFVGSTAREITSYRLGTTNASGLADMRVPDGDVVIVFSKDGYVPVRSRLTKAGVVERTYSLDTYTIFSRDMCGFSSERELRESALCSPVTVPVSFWVRGIGSGSSYYDIAYATVVYTARAGSVYYAIKATSDESGMAMLDMPGSLTGATLWILSDDHYPETFVTAGSFDTSSSPISVFMLPMPGR